jgi:hypothetical protein
MLPALRHNPLMYVCWQEEGASQEGVVVAGPERLGRQTLPFFLAYQPL